MVLHTKDNLLVDVLCVSSSRECSSSCTPTKVVSNSHESVRALGLEAGGGDDEGVPRDKGDGGGGGAVDGGGEGGGGDGTGSGGDGGGGEGGAGQVWGPEQAHADVIWPFTELPPSSGKPMAGQQSRP